MTSAALARRRRLLILAGEVVFADRLADRLERFQRLARGMQGLAFLAADPTWSEPRLDVAALIPLGDRGQNEVVPPRPGREMAGQIVLVQPLHDQQDAALLLVVQPAEQGGVEPLVDPDPGRVRERLVRLERVVDDDQVGASAGQHPVHRRRHPHAVLGGGQLVDGKPVQARAGEQVLVPVALHDGTAVAGQLVGQLGAVAGADDLHRRVVPEQPCRQGDRSQQRLQVTRRQVDDHAAALWSRNNAIQAATSSMCHPGVNCTPGLSCRKHRCGERLEIGPQQSLIGPVLLGVHEEPSFFKRCRKASSTCSSSSLPKQGSVLSAGGAAAGSGAADLPQMLEEQLDRAMVAGGRLVGQLLDRDLELRHLAALAHSR